MLSLAQCFLFACRMSVAVLGTLLSVCSRMSDIVLGTVLSVCL